MSRKRWWPLVLLGMCWLSRLAQSTNAPAPHAARTRVRVAVRAVHAAHSRDSPARTYYSPVTDAVDRAAAAPAAYTRMLPLICHFARNIRARSRSLRSNRV